MYHHSGHLAPDRGFCTTTLAIWHPIGACAPPRLSTGGHLAPDRGFRTTRPAARGIPKPPPGSTTGGHLTRHLASGEVTGTRGTRQRARGGCRLGR
ncbi:conserved hypothetical protein [Nostocoides japonicum T1-X7]|uniref:Uncharacterized protein n=1 Tax=Nostocoides japonicum T1-X7 TaxID=1194083 RepID=A0A077LWE2_9MICO|nr:conserved hypothetical protein [Tetrasphaera japonica T1-X7]